MTDLQSLLNDEAMGEFIANGYVQVRADFPDEFHRGVCQSLDDMFAGGGQLGNNLLPFIPQLRELFDHPNVSGALTSILGPNFVMHPHRYCHRNLPQSRGQERHRDTYEGEERSQRHRTRWVIAMYYPQDTNEEMGPTGIWPGTQYYESAESVDPADEMPACGPAGTVTVVHFDLWHRAMPNRSRRNRYMLKFNLFRMEEPDGPSWKCENREWVRPGNIAHDHDHEEVWHRLWNWHLGEAPDRAVRSDGNGDPAELIAMLGAEDEARGLDAAYALGSAGSEVVPAVVATLRAGSVAAQRNAALALAAKGGAAASELSTVLLDGDPGARTGAARALGDIGTEAMAAVQALCRAIEDEDDYVRQSAAEALGIIGAASGDAVSALIDYLQDDCEGVRSNAGRSLAKLGPDADAAAPALAAALRDGSRYVRFFAALALKQIDSSASRDLLFDDLFKSRWCSLTNAESPF